ncbi:MAG: hypothetical protein FJW38_17215 [Acidobacteria bacterium]|nr:hypothetical protein [Acidobacteriota bacterium]
MNTVCSAALATSSGATISMNPACAIDDRLRQLQQAARALRQAESTEQWTQILADTAGRLASAVLFFRVDGGKLHCDATRGASQPSTSIAASDAPAFRQAVETKETVVALHAASELSEAIANAIGDPGRRAHLFPLVGKTRVLGVLLAEGLPDVHAMELLMTLAAASLELRNVKPATPLIAPAPSVAATPTATERKALVAGAKKVLALSLIAIAANAAPSCEAESRALRAKLTPQTRAQVEKCITRNGDTAQSAAARLALGVTNIEGQNHAAALAFLDKAAKPLAKIDDYLAFFKAQALAALNRHEDALATLDAVWKQPGGSPITGRAALLAAKSAQAIGKPDQALRILKSQEAALPQPQGDMAIAEASKSGDDYARVYFRYPSSTEAVQAAVQWRALGAPSATPENYLARIEKASGAQAASIRTELAQASPNWPAAQRELALVRTWAIDHRARRYAGVRAGLAALTLTTPEADAERTGLLYDTARRMNLEADRTAAFRRLAMNHVGSRAYLDALLAEADRHLRENEFTAYEPLYKACADKYDRDEKASFCHWKVVWSSYLRRRAGAEQLLREHLQRFPHSEKANAALYFLGRIEEKRHKPAFARAYFDAAASRFPNTYYALIAADRANGLPQADDDATQWIANVRWPQRTALSATEPPSAQNRRERAALLRLAGLDNYVEQELRHGAREFASPIRLATDLAEFMTSIGQADKGLRYVKNLLPGYLYFPWDPAGEKFWRHAFPLPFQEDLHKYAKENSVDPFVVAGLIRQESEFNPKVISYANAYGLTQILPSTGRELSRRVGMRDFSTPMLFDPAVNLRLGTFYLKTMLASFNGRWEDVLAGFNAGPSRVIKWRRWTNYEEQAEFIETVPFDQTRDYIQSVLRNAAVYKKLYARDLALIKSTNEPKPVVAASKRTGRFPAAR